MKELVFIYNADSGIFNSLTDFAHKIFSPSTYPCVLCSLTYGNFTMKREWKNFIESLPVKTSFVHKDEFEQHTRSIKDFPLVLIRNGNNVKTFLDKQQLENCNDLNSLMELVRSQLNDYD